MARKLVVILISLIVFAAAQAKALGLGDITLESALNQPLLARIELLELGGVRAEDVRIQLASNSDFQRFAIERPFFLESIRFGIESSGNRSFVTLSTTEVVREPYLSFVLETRWPNGRLLSEYTVLMDLPVFGSQSVLQTAQPPARSIVEDTPTQNIQNQQITQTNSSSARAEISRAAAQDSTQTPPENTVSTPPAAVVDQAPEPLPDSTDSVVEQVAVAEEAVPEPVTEVQPVANVQEEIPEPARFASQPATISGETVTVEAADTLWNIALEVRPDNAASVQQTMLAIQRLNSDAFIGNNINLIRRGQVLRIPDLNEILAITQQQAVAEVAQQNQLFADRRNAPVSVQPLTAQPAAQGTVTGPATGELSVVTSDSQDSATGDASGAGSDAARIAALENAAAVSNEEADRLLLQNNELTARLTMLEEQIASAQEIIRLRDLELAQLQESLAAQSQETASQASEAPALVTMAPEQDSSNLLNSLLSNTYAIIGAVLLIILVLVFLLLRRNRSAQVSEFSGISAMDNETSEARQYTRQPANQAFASLDEEEFEQTRYTDYKGSPDFKPDELDDFDELDLDADLADSDAQGLDGKNLDDSEYDDINLDDEDLDDKNLDEPDSDDRAENDIMDDLNSFDLAELEQEIAAATASYADSSDADVETADGDEVLDQADAFIAYEQLDEAKDLLQNAIVAEPDRSDLRLKLQEVEGADPETTATEQEKDTKEDEEDFDFDFDLADMDEEPVAEDLHKSQEEDQDSDDTERVAFDFSEEDDDSEAIEFNIDDLSLDVSEPEKSVEHAGSAEPVETVEFEIDDEPEAEAESDSQDTDAVEFENLEFVSTEEDADNDDDVGEDISFLTDSDEAATKLDLARAYIDMGDNEGAREILEEVLDEGTEAQMRDAKSLLERIQ